MMDRHQDWHRVAAILEAALELPPGARAAFVRDACAGDQDLLEEIVSLLVAHAEAGGFLEGVPIGDTTAITVPVLPPGAGVRLTSGQRVGRYRVDRLLGCGGMGEVYAAEDVEYGRRVALKVIGGGLRTAEERERFLREGQLAAAVNHPNSVYIFGSDIIDGSPIIVMELLGGGTLKDRVRVEGPLRPAAAVDAILQVIAGLDAAYTGGILHRDIKPANCFVDRDGTVKIGDFGLSISTTADLQGTFTATLQMTPQFAAPERLKGAAPDVRAEIYGVGATLFYLLTGEPPFDTRDLLALLTRIVGELPRSPGAVVTGIPRGLSDVVLRCLAKQPENRFGSYAALRKALVPFGSHVLRTAPAGARVAAMVVDELLVSVLVMATSAIAIAVSGRLPVAGVARAAAVMTAYFVATEAFGGSPGKRLLRLRVVDRDGGKPRFGAVVLRTAVYVFVAELPFVIPFDVWVRLLAPDTPLLAWPIRAEALGRLSAIITVVGWLTPLILFVTARPRHGLAGLHELLSGTRVCRVNPELAPKHSIPARAEGRQQQPHAAPVGRETASRRGSFVLRNVWTQSDDRTVWLAFDPALRRDVFIVDHGGGASIAPSERRDLARPGRLRWLAGQEGSPTWEAFDAPPGTPALTLAMTPRPWSDVRIWLLDLARELAACEETGEAVAFTKDHVWIALNGHAMLLDFPAPRTTPPSDDGVDGTRSTARNQRLLWDVAVPALTGRMRRPGAAPTIRPPLPLSGTALLRALAGSVPMSARELLPLCERAADGETMVPRLSRVWPAAALMFGMLVLTFMAMIVNGLAGQLMFPGVSSGENALLDGLVRVDRLDRAGIAATDPQRRALEIFLVRAFGLSERVATMGGILRPYRTLAADIARRHPSPSLGELEAAVAVLGKVQLDAMSRAAPPANGFGGLLFLLLALTEIVLPVFTVVGLVAVVLAVALRGGLLWRLLHLRVVDEASTPASRGRAFFRALVAWAPAFALFAIRESVFRAAMAGDTDVWVIAALLLATAIALAMGWGTVMPSRGLQERLSRTWIVPA
jgi:uncharacterized RDD family membrane protein YckC